MFFTIANLTTVLQCFVNQEWCTILNDMIRIKHCVCAGNPDPWCVESSHYPRTDHTRPHIIYTMEDYRVVGCVDCMDDQHYINYLLINVNEVMTKLIILLV